MAGICNSVGGGVFLTCTMLPVVNVGVCVNARVVNRKQVDVVALRSDRSGCPGMH